MESWMCFPEVQRLNFGRASQRSMDLNLDMLPRGLLKLNFGRASQSSDGFEFGHASERSIEIEF